MKARVARTILAGAAALGAAVLALAPREARAEGFHFRTLPLVSESGLFDGDAAEPREAWSTTVRAPGAAVVRVAFAEAQLGAGSWITIRSLADGAVHRLDAKSLPEWGRMSALLNGEAAEVTLHVAPGDRDVFVRLAGVAGSEPPTRIESQCGASDDRVVSTDNRVARISPIGCTAWRIGNGAFLTAGHCADDDPDDAGAQLPDGVLDWNANTIIEFNVPDSQANGNWVASAPQDQYPIVLNSVQWVFAGNGMPLGNDWCVFRVNANSNTGLLPHQVYGLPFRITREMPANGTGLRVTGFGIDTGIDNSTNQTSTGTLSGETLGTGTARVNPSSTPSRATPDRRSSGRPISSASASTRTPVARPTAPARTPARPSSSTRSRTRSTPLPERTRSTSTRGIRCRSTRRARSCVRSGRSAAASRPS
jgi:hypothetical protein